MTRPPLLFYCQHSLGLGHLVRSLLLADALSEHFDVTLLNGGRLPEGAVVPRRVRLLNLPPLGHDASYGLVSHDPLLDVDAARAARRQTILEALELLRPAVILVELYPFGRKHFAFELEPLLERAASLGERRPTVLCSLRDILVNQRRDQARHDERAAQTANAFFDAVLVHADPAFATLEESFRPATPLAIPVRYTGFVAPPAPAAPPAGAVAQRLIVSAGGGMVGEPLLRAAAAAAPRIRAATGLDALLVAGPFLPDDAWERLVAERAPHVEVVRRIDDLAGAIARSAVSVSQGGYNTTMDLLRARTPAVVVPYSEGKEDEQRRRAERLAALGALHVVAPEELAPERLADAVIAALATPVAPLALDLDGAQATARIARELVAARAPRGAFALAAPA